MADNLLVNRDGQTYQVDMENTKSIQDTDLLLVNRNGTTYTVAGSEISRGEFSEVVITPTSIVPEVSEQILTAVTDIPKVGSDVPADVYWSWYQYDQATGEVGKTLLKTLTNREASDTLVLPAAAAGKFIGCSVTYLAVTISETERCAVGNPPGPTAVMNGLRFDSARNNYLEGGKGTNKFTHSFWIKPTGRMRFLFMKDGTGGSVETVWEMNSNRLYFGNAGTAKLFPAQELELKKWQHVVLQNDPEGDSAIYLDGVLLSSEAGLPSLDWNDQVLRIGVNTQGSGGDGYMSDVYYISDKILPPTTFAKQFPEGWGPLDSTVVKAALANEVQAPEQVQPYDTRANTDEVWSSQVTPADANTAKIFDGDLTTSASNTNVLWNTNITGVETLEIYTQASGLNAGSYSTLEINGEDKTADLVDANGWNTISNPPETLTSIDTNFVSSGNKIDVFGIKINGRLLVDQGVWDTSQNWTGGAFVTAPYVNRTIHDAFKGTREATEALYCYESGTPFTANFWGFNIPIDGTQEVKFLVSAPTGHTIRVQIGSDPANQLEVSNESIVEIPVSRSAAAITQFTITDTAPGGNAQFTFYGIKVDGVLLVNQGTQWDTSEVWSDLISIPTPTPANYPRGTFTGVLPPGITPDSGNVATINSNTDGTPDGATLPYSTNNSTVRIYYKQNPTYSKLNTLTVGNKQSTEEVSLGNNLYYAEVTGATGSSIEITFDYLGGGGSTIYLLQYQVDGKALTDKQIEWNTDEVWSRGLTLRYTGDTYFSNEPSNAFNGDYDTGCFMTNSNSAADCSVTFTPSLPITVQDNIKVTWKINENYRGYYFQINDEDPVSIDIYIKHTFTLPFTGTLNTLKIYSTNSISTGQNFGALYAIQVDDKLLVDQGNMGANGFYLPFDTTAKGTADYPNLWDRNDMIVETPIFDGTEGKVYQTQKTVDDGVSQYATWALPEPIGSNFEIAFRVQASGGYAVTGQANGEAVTGGMYGSNPYAVARRDFPLESVTIQTYAKEGGNAQQNLAVEYIKVDGKILVDYRSIGADDSGAGNNFKDYNFVVGNNPAAPYTSTIDKTKFTPTDGGYRSPSNIFDGNLDTYGATRLGFGSNIYAFDWSALNLPECKKLRVFIKGTNLNGNDYLRVNLNNLPGTPLLSRDLDTANGCWVDLSLASSYSEGVGFSDQFPLSTVTRLYVDLQQGNNTVQGIYAIEYNGQLLMDASFADSVKDSPMSSYATYRDGSNGNLVQIGNSYSTLDADGKQIYFESFISPSSSPASTHIRVYDGAGTNAYVRGDGLTNNVSLIDGSTLSWSKEDLIGTVYDGNTDQFTFYKNGNYTATYQVNSANLTDSERYPTMDGSGQTCTINFGQQVFNYADDLGNGLVTLKIDDSQVWSDGQQPGNYDREWDKAFDGIVTNHDNAIWPSWIDGQTNTVSWTGNIPVNGESVKVVAWFQDTTTAGQAFVVNGVDVTSAFSGVGASYSLQTRDITSFVTEDSITSMSLSRSVGNHGQMGVLGIYVGGKLLVDTGVLDKGPFSKLSQSWSEWVIQTLLAKGAEADALKVMLLDHAQTYQASEDYCEGSVIKAFGELWIAVNEAPATSFADLAAISSHANWERLNISVN